MGSGLFMEAELARRESAHSQVAMVRAAEAEGFFRESALFMPTQVPYVPGTPLSAHRQTSEVSLVSAPAV